MIILNYYETNEIFHFHKKNKSNNPNLQVLSGAKCTENPWLAKMTTPKVLIVKTIQIEINKIRIKYTIQMEKHTMQNKMKYIYK